MESEYNYLTDKLFLFQDKLYYENNCVKKEIKNHNWQHYLKDYGWEKLHKNWIKKLNSYLEKPTNNSLYGSLDCGEEGDCLFHCISYVLNLNSDEYYDAKLLRSNISNSLSESRFNEIIEIYKIMNDSDDFEENWNPHETSFSDFKKLINEGGNNFWGDFLMLNLIKEYLNYNIIVLNSNENTGEFYYYPLFYEYDENIETIILLYENEIHFKLVGHFLNGKMRTVFKHIDLPFEILKLIKYLR